MNNSFVCDPTAIGVFLFDHFTRSYGDNLFIWPSSQSPKADSVWLLFFIAIAWLSAHHWKVFGVLFWKPCILALHTGHLVVPFMPAQMCLARGTRGTGVAWFGAVSEEAEPFFSQRGMNLQGCMSQMGHLLISNKVLYRFSISLIGRANQTQQNVENLKLERNSYPWEKFSVFIQELCDFRELIVQL